MQFKIAMKYRYQASNIMTNHNRTNSLRLVSYTVVAIIRIKIPIHLPKFLSSTTTNGQIRCNNASNVAKLITTVLRILEPAV